jgi:hypothetical protein
LWQGDRENKKVYTGQVECGMLPKRPRGLGIHDFEVKIQPFLGNGSSDY